MSPKELILVVHVVAGAMVGKGVNYGVRISHSCQTKTTELPLLLLLKILSRETKTRRSESKPSAKWIS